MRFTIFLIGAVFIDNKNALDLRFPQNISREHQQKPIVSTLFDHDVSTGYYLRIYFYFSLVKT